MFLIYGDENFFIDEKVKEIKQKYTEENIIVFNDKFEYSQVLDHLYSNSLFAQNKLILIENCDLFLTKKLSSEQKDFLNQLLLQANQPNSNEVVFIIRKLDLAENELTQLLQKNNQVFKCLQIPKKDLPKQLVNYIKNKGGDITPSNLMYLLEKLPENLTLIMQEINKLLLETRDITKEVIDKSVGQYVLDDSFGLSNAFESNDFNVIWKAYKQKKYEGIDINTLISQMANVFILANKVYHLRNLNWDNAKIASFLKVHEFRIKKASLLLSKYSLTKIENIIEDLLKLDSSFKSSTIDNEAIFESFLVKHFIGKQQNEQLR
ncbi:DNA polymerase III subunit delta [Mycoplasmopsis columboralis]|uniref:DNA polymerase III subunit delta n=1 Tax=Mycoplasmopsis columboralis TaxID=171282 RepID=A0A449B7M0_9BACT|nr:DNA polymerase III subunit delta [Mycoplasmopsis columboralis]VEU76569.1 DNA-directed DNA polymerase [Mycoplasmopsis columboralis]